MNKNNYLLLLFILGTALTTFSQSKKELKKQLENKQQVIDSLSNLLIPKQDLTSLKDSFSYALGVDLYDNNLVPQGLDTSLNADAFYLGVKMAETHNDTIPINERQAIMQRVFNEMQAKKQAEAEKLRSEAELKAQESLVKGQIFMAQNAQKPEVVSLPNGLQYKIMKSGNPFGSSPKPESTVTVNYQGMFTDRSVFETTFNGNNPATFPVNRVIPGWTEILQLMKEGDTWEVYIPANLAYGKNGGGKIGPNETLIFVIELLKITD